MSATKDAAASASSAQDEPLNTNSKPSFTRRACKKAYDIAAEHWFMLALGFSIGFAAAVPDFGRTGGWVRSEWSVKYGAVIIIFILSGLSLKSKVLFTAMTSLPTHILIQLICLGLTPAIGFAIYNILIRTPMHSLMSRGFVISLSMPTTISTNVVFTKQAGGNDAIALINAVIGNIIGIFVSPALLLAYLNESSQAPYKEVLENLSVTIIAPLVAGQLVQYKFPDFVQKLQKKINFGKISNVMILLLVWSTFCNSFSRNLSVDAGSVVVMAFLDLLVYLCFMVMCVAIARSWPARKALKLRRTDAIAVAMCGSTKTLALGMPLITVIYGKSPDAGILALPLLMYHAGQIFLGNFLIKPLRQWRERDPDDQLPTQVLAPSGSSSETVTPGPKPEATGESEGVSAGDGEVEDGVGEKGLGVSEGVGVHRRNVVAPDGCVSDMPKDPLIPVGRA